MIGREGCEAVLQRALDAGVSPVIPAKAEIHGATGAWDTEAYLVVQDLGLTRFAANTIHQNVSHGNAQLHIRAASGHRQGRATTNDLSESGIARAVQSARHNALLMPEDPDFHGLASPGAPVHVPTFDRETAEFSPSDRAEAVALACGKAAGFMDKNNGGLESSGFCRSGVQETAVMSTRGARAYHASTFAGFLITVMSHAPSGERSAGWSKGGSWRVSEVDAESLADEAIAKAVDGRDPRAIEPGEYTVVLDPYAVDDMLNALSRYGMGAQTVQDGRSWMNGILGAQAMSPLVSIWDDGTDKAGWPTPFDAEGVPRRETHIVKDGVVTGPVHNSYTAGKEGVVSTGHQFSSGGGPLAANLFMATGKDSLDQMIASTTRGLYVTRFHYIRLVHNRGCTVTGMTRDGTFLIKDGRISHPVKDLRFTQSFVEALANVEAVGNQRKLCLNEVGFATCVPALKIAGFNFTGVTV